MMKTLKQIFFRPQRPEAVYTTDDLIQLALSFRGVRSATWHEYVSPYRRCRCLVVDTWPWARRDVLSRITQEASRRWVSSVRVSNYMVLRKRSYERVCASDRARFNKDGAR
jgi:hypothetical protein